MSRPNGDSIADQVRHHLRTDSDLSDVARSLTDAHAHRPGHWQQDLARTNAALHERGILPGIDIVGIRGQDFVGRDSEGRTQIIDATNVYTRHEDRAANTRDMAGRPATQNPDGSGTVQARAGDNRQWQLSQDILKAQGIERPTPNQMANFQIELERLNGRPVSQFRPGDQIRIPASSQGGDQTEFVGDRADRRARQQLEDANRQASEARAALEKFAGHGFNSSNLNRDDINQALRGPNLTPADTRGLQFLRDHYDEIAESGLLYRNAVYGSGIDRWTQTQATRIEQERVLAYRN
ncbi:MAG TPA: hypothetical protein V6C89_22070 [Drouetiella sp.]|jgi:hypothetical protein